MCETMADMVTEGLVPNKPWGIVRGIEPRKHSVVAFGGQYKDVEELGLQGYCHSVTTSCKGKVVKKSSYPPSHTIR